MSPRKSTSTPPPSKNKKIVAFKADRKSESVVEYERGEAGHLSGGEAGHSSGGEAGHSSGAAGAHPSYDNDDLPTPLTLKEKNVLEFLELYIRENGISPTYSEICQHFGFASYNSVQRYLKQLETKGYVRTPGGNQKRALMLLRPASAVQETVEEFGRDTSDASASNVRNVMPALNPSAEVLNLPMLGRVAAGAPIEAYEHDEYIDVPASLVRHADRTYALRVQGQSMIEDGIFDGDVILVQRQSQASNGEIVVAMIGEEATVKRFYTHNKDPRSDSTGTEGGHSSGSFGKQKMIELRPANSNMSSLWFVPNEVQIRGVVVGLIRKF